MALEVVAQLWVRKIARRGKLFTVDSELGWRPLANLRLDRRNADGGMWRVVTDSAGWRPGRTLNPSASRRVLVLGDSYVFGEGVNVEDRFDELAARGRPELRFINRGVMGYGTDQQVLAGRPTIDSLHRGDLVLLVTYQNDMIDIQRRSFVGRAKPRFERAGESLLLRPAQVTWRERLRDASYLGALVFAARERGPESYSREEWGRGIDLYRAIVQALERDLTARNIGLIVLHHGDSLLVAWSGRREPYRDLARMPQTRVVPLDDALASCPDAPVFLRDGHWGPGGHRCVAERVVALLGDSAPATPSAESERRPR